MLADLGLPFSVVHGHIGKISLDIPWKQLFPTPKKPVVVVIEGVYLVVSPAAAKPYDADAEAEAARGAKKKAIAAHDEAKAKAESEADQAKNASFVTKLVTSIINNLQLTLRHVHIRYEDGLTHADHPFAAGVTISGLTATTTNEKWEPQFLSGMPVLVNKLVELQALSVYYDTDTKPLPSGPDWLEHCIRLIPTATTPVPHQYLVAPISSQLKLTLNTRGEAARVPKLTAAIDMNRFTLAIDEDQLQDVMLLTDSMARFHLQKQYQRFRPHAPRRTRPTWVLDWWQYAIKCVVHDIHERRRRHSWDHLRARRDARLQYKAAYRDFRSSSKPPARLVKVKGKKEKKKKK